MDFLKDIRTGMLTLGIRVDSPQLQCPEYPFKARNIINDLSEWRKFREEAEKSKFLPIPDRAMPDQLPIATFPLASRQLKEGNWVPLYYWTDKGLDDAKDSRLLMDGEMMSPIRVPSNSISIVPTRLLKEYRSVLKDQDLDFEEFSIACLRSINAMREVGWPEERVKMMEQFWRTLQIHPLHLSGHPLVKKAILIYQEEQRWSWHCAMKKTPEQANNLNLSKIDEQALCEIRERLYQKERDSWVRPFPFLSFK